MLGLLTKDTPLRPVNDDPRVVAARAKTQAARIEADHQAEDEQRLRSILEPAFESATTTPVEITPEMLHEANTRLLPRKFGVTDCRFADTREGTQARATLKAMQTAEAQIRAEVRRDLEQQVKAKAADLCDELESALKPAQALARELLALREESDVPVPVTPSLLPGGSVEHELPLLKNWATS